MPSLASRAQDLLYGVAEARVSRRESGRPIDTGIPYSVYLNKAFVYSEE
jgi:hypothetical protein